MYKTPVWGCELGVSAAASYGFQGFQHQFKLARAGACRKTKETAKSPISTVRNLPIWAEKEEEDD